MRSAPSGFINSFRIGCDPEFGILNKDGVSLEYLDISSFRSDEVGQDGQHTVELRPKAAMTVVELLNNVKILLESPKLKKFHKNTWKAGATVKVKNIYSERVYYTSIGGHVHIEVPYSRGARCNDSSNFVPHKIAEKRIAAMDIVVKFLEELDIHPKEECIQRRADGNYGRFSSFYNVVPTEYSIPRIEYRTPCSWLLSPSIAYITLTALKLAVVSPEAAFRVLQLGSTEKMFESLNKLFKLYQHVDVDSFTVANKIIRTPNALNLSRLQAKPNEDFRVKWLTKPVEKMLNQTF